jgi:hypothetical protein
VLAPKRIHPQKYLEFLSLFSFHFSSVRSRDRLIERITEKRSPCPIIFVYSHFQYDRLSNSNEFLAMPFPPLRASKPPHLLATEKPFFSGVADVFGNFAVFQWSPQKQLQISNPSSKGKRFGVKHFQSKANHFGC